MSLVQAECSSWLCLRQYGGSYWPKVKMVHRIMIKELRDVPHFRRELALYRWPQLRRGTDQQVRLRKKWGTCQGIYVQQSEFKCHHKKDLYTSLKLLLADALCMLCKATMARCLKPNFKLQLRLPVSSSSFPSFEGPMNGSGLSYMRLRVVKYNAKRYS